MAVIRGPAPAYEPPRSTVNLQTTLTGNVSSTNTADRGNQTSGCFLKVVSTIGSTPTVTLNIQGSIDGVTFYNIPYGLQATPTTFVITAITITTATTNYYILQGSQPWRFIKTVMSANTNVTLTIDVTFPGV
jgi:hypothetical protein